MHDSRSATWGVHLISSSLLLGNVKIAVFTMSKDGNVVFQWLDSPTPPACTGLLWNCLLNVKSTRTGHETIRPLRRALQKEPLTFDMLVKTKKTDNERPSSVTTNQEIKYLPDRLALHLQLYKEGCSITPKFSGPQDHRWTVSFANNKSVRSQFLLQL